MMKKLSFYLVSLGCPKNEADLEQAATRLKNAGHRRVRALAQADLVVVNTCGFIDDAEQESRAAIAELAPGPNDRRKVLVMGCLGQLMGRELLKEYPFVDAVLGPGQYHRIALVVEKMWQAARPAYCGKPSFVPAQPSTVRLTPRHYAYLRISEGCDHRCNYCLIPDLRGVYRSRKTEHIIAEAKQRVKEGAKELVVIGQDTTRYGADLGKGINLALLLRELAQLDNLAWLRLMYAHPANLTDELLQVMAAEEKIVNYLDIPVQHSHPAILRAMRRPAIDNVVLVKHIRDMVPGITLRTTLLTGFPGEGEDEFAHLCDFVEQARFDRLGVFAYSPRRGTPAFSLPGHVDPAVKGARRETLLDIQETVMAQKNESLLGTTVRVMVDSRADGWCAGRTAGDAPEIDQLVKFRGKMSRGRVVQVKLTEATEFGFLATTT